MAKPSNPKRPSKKPAKTVKRAVPVPSFKAKAAVKRAKIGGKAASTPKAKLAGAKANKNSAKAQVAPRSSVKGATQSRKVLLSKRKSKSSSKPAAKPNGPLVKLSVSEGAKSSKSGSNRAAILTMNGSRGGSKPSVKPAPAQALLRSPSRPVAQKPSPPKLSAGSGVLVEAKPDRKVEKPMKKSKEADRRGIPVPAPVPTDSKPSKNLAGLKASELEHYRDLLLAKRRELVGDMNSMESEALQRGGNSNLSNLPMHMADMGTDNYEQEFTLGLMETDRKLLREINNALAKIQDGTYGICEGTQAPIGKPRLEAQPWARFSIEHARKLEQRLIR